MKWIGQHIWSFISRFRSDVYLENVTESAQDHVVGIDADGKLYKQDVATGDITGVTITTDSGGGSAASDTSGSADFSILGSSGVGVTNSGTTITAVSVPGEIDHDSLLNFVAQEHVAWGNDQSGGGISIHTNNIVDLHGAGVDGSANQLLTDDGDGTITSESSLSYNSETLSIGNDDDGIAIIQRDAHSDGGGGPLVVSGGSAIAGQTNQTGGDLRLYGGAPTGDAAWGDIEFWAGVTGSSGTALNASRMIGVIKGNGTTLNEFLLYEPYDGSSDNMKIAVAANGVTEISTTDSDGSLGHLTLFADGDTIIKTTGGIASKDFKINVDSNTAFLFNGESGNMSLFTMYEMGGDSATDYLAIQVEEHGATIIQTTDGGGSNANLQITADGTAELAGTTVTLDSAANVELEVGATTNYVQTTGVFRGSNIGTIQDDKIPVSPTQFITDSFRYAPQYVIADGGIAPGTASINYYAEIVIPNGYTATACTMYATDADNDGTIRCYEGSTIANTSSAVASADTFSSGSVTHDFGSNDVVGNGSKTVIIVWNPGDTADRLHGGFISITKTT